MVLKKEITSQIRDLLRQHPQGLNITAIVHSIRINRSTAGKYLENLMVSGQVEMRRFGMAKIYRLAQRVPLSATLSISSELIVLLDSGMRVVYANDQFLQFFCTTQKDLYGKNIEYTPVVPVFDDTFDTVKKHLRSGIAGKEWYGELPLQHRGLVFACRVAPAVFEEGQKGVSVLLEDITERKKAEETIKESEHQFRMLAEHSLDMIHRHTPDDICIYISPASKTILGYEPEEIIGQSIYKFLNPEDAPVVPAYKSRLTRKHPVAKITYRVRHKDGHDVWLESVLRAIFDEKSGEFLEVYGVTRDITEQRKAQETLRESEDRYRTLVEISPDAVILHRHGKILYMNPAAFRLLGASPEDDVIGKSIFSFIHPDFRDMVKKNIQKDLRGESTPPMEVTMVRRDGTAVIVEGRGVGTTFEGKPAIQVALRDITRRKKAEQALRGSEATARALINAPTDSVLLLDTDGTILDLNTTAASRLGRRREELVGLVADTVIPADVAQQRRSIISEVLRTKEAVRFEDGRDGMWFDTVAYPVIDESGEVRKVAVIARDITRRRHAEEALRSSEERYRALAETSQDLIFVVGRDDVVTYVNPAAAAMLGKDPAAIIGMRRASFFPRELAERQGLGLQKVFATGQPVRSEGPMPVGAGTRWFDHFLMPIRNSSGQVVSVLGVSRDISDRKQAEAAHGKGGK